MDPNNSILNNHPAEQVSKATCGTSSTVEQLAPLAAAAFKDDPFNLYAYCRDAERNEQEKILQGAFHVVIQDWFSRLERRVLHMDDSGRCFAVWSLMGKEPDELGNIIRLLLSFIMKIGLRRTFQMAPLFDALHRAHPTKPHVYLMIFATHPDVQGQGLGSAVMKKMMSYLDEHQLPAYTESTNPRNLPFYKRHGFEIIEQPISTLPEGIPPCTGLWREPETSK